MRNLLARGGIEFLAVLLGSSALYNGGVIQNLNSKGREVVHIGSDKPTEDGKVILFDENGGSGWTLKGRR